MDNDNVFTDCRCEFLGQGNIGGGACQCMYESDFPPLSSIALIDQTKCT